MTPDHLSLDLADPVNAGALQAALDEVCSVDPVHEPFVRRVLEECPDPLLAGQARVLLAAFEQARGDDNAAADLYRTGLADVWGSGTRAEANALVNYAAVCVTQRRSFEGLALLRRARELAEERDNAAALALSSAYLARTLVELEDWSRVAPLLDEIEALLPRLDDGPRDYVEMVAVTTAIEAAFRRGDAAGARSAKHRLETLRLEQDPRGRPFHRALVLATEGQHDAARDEIAAVRTMGGDTEKYAAALLDVELACFPADAPLDAWRGRAEELLDLLGDASNTAHSAGDRMVMARRRAERLRNVPGADDLAERAIAIASAGVIERIAELERFLRALPQLCFSRPADQEILDDYRERFLARHEALLDDVQRRLGAAPADAPQLGDTRANDPLWVCVCAWCRLLRGPDGVWLPVRRLGVPSGPVQVTHGICERCRERELARGFGGT